ncbi:MAG TPA: Mur ligase family protein, partial [Polyangiales bacterium]|nr:Mur ligase family protein [Polyangiales bacterium]
VAEADESDGSFLHLSPVVSVITNIDPEHLDHYGSLDAVKRAFIDFANKVPFYGLVIACLDHPEVQNILPRIEKRTLTYGLSTQADYSAKQVTAAGLHTRFEVIVRGQSIGDFELSMPGVHNVQNALSVIAVADELGVDRAVTRRALKEFGGVQRRFTVRGSEAGVTVVDDYAHHPAELRAILAAAQQAYGRRVVAVFQPHRYTRTQLLFQEFASAFNAADVLFVTGVYAAGETPIAGADSQHLVQAMRGHGHRDVTHVAELAAVVPALLPRLQDGDVVLTLGAGSITGLGPQLLAALKQGGRRGA